MLVDIEPEYNDFIHNSWRKLSDPTRDILKFRQNSNQTYNFISLRLIHFLQLKLNKLESKNPLTKIHNPTPPKSKKVN